ncbi:MAG: DUF3369 domain-containing protein [Thermodesulfobacteriota bacterium]
MSDEELIFADEDGVRPEQAAPAEAWKVLIVDDDEEVHSITTLVLRDFSFGGRALTFFHAYDGQQARQIMAQHPDMAVVFLDVVMEQDDAGLHVVDYIRKELRNYLVRIILRTGQPGMAPEEQIIVKYDINDYKEKTELSSQKLVTVLVASLRTYQHLLSIDTNQQGLRHIIKASSALFECGSMEKLAGGVLTHLITLLGQEPDALVCRFDQQDGEAGAEEPLQAMTVLAACGTFGHLRGSGQLQELSSQAQADLLFAAQKQTCLYLDERYVGYFASESGSGVLIYCETWRSLSDLHKALVEIYCANVQIAFANAMVTSEIEENQCDMAYTMGEFAEARSGGDSSGHLRRVAVISECLGRLAGLSEREVEVLRLAAPMHDIGKVAVPEEILKAPGKLSPEEYATMKGHAELGYEMLASSKRDIMQAAAVIAMQHHERFDGKGYPSGLSGENIHIYARLVGLVDVYDALSSERAYRPAYEPAMVADYLQNERGKHFDPALVDIFLANLGEIEAAVSALA